MSSRSSLLLWCHCLLIILYSNLRRQLEGAQKRNAQLGDVLEENKKVVASAATPARSGS